MNANAKNLWSYLLHRGGTTRSRERIELYSEAISKGSTDLLYIN